MSQWISKAFLKKRKKKKKKIQTKKRKAVWGVTNVWEKKDTRREYLFIKRQSTWGRRSSGGQVEVKEWLVT